MISRRFFGVLSVVFLLLSLATMQVAAQHMPAMECVEITEKLPA